MMMDAQNWIDERLAVLYEDAQYECVSNIKCHRMDPEAVIIAVEQRNLVSRLAWESLQHSQASAIEMMLSGEAGSQAAAARDAGITQVQLHRAIKRIKQKIDSLTA